MVEFVIVPGSLFTVFKVYRFFRSYCFFTSVTNLTDLSIGSRLLNLWKFLLRNLTNFYKICAGGSYIYRRRYEWDILFRKFCIDSTLELEISCKKFI
jgi:hypothetical protein